MDLEDILKVTGLFFMGLALLLVVIFTHIDIAKHEENETMLEKYRIEMQYLLYAINVMYFISF